MFLYYVNAVKKIVLNSKTEALHALVYTRKIDPKHTISIGTCICENICDRYFPMGGFYFRQPDMLGSTKVKFLQVKSKS